MPPRNQKLTHAVSGKRITDIAPTAGAVVVRFDDHSVLTVQGTMAEPAPVSEALGRVTAAQEDGAELVLKLDGGGTVQLVMTDPGGSVLLRDAAGVVRYAG